MNYYKKGVLHMTFDISQYRLKHIVSIRPGLMDYIPILFDIDGSSYKFKVEDVRSEYIEYVQYFKHTDIRYATRPIEKEINEITHGKSKNQMTKKHQYYAYNSTFKLPIEGEQYEFEITGIGPSAVKLSLYLRYNNIEKSTVSFERSLKKHIYEEYSELIEGNSSYQSKLNELKKEYDAQQTKQAAIEEEVRKEQEEKERKRRELEEFLNSHKTI